MRRHNRVLATIKTWIKIVAFVALCCVVFIPRGVKATIVTPQPGLDTLLYSSPASASGNFNRPFYISASDVDAVAAGLQLGNNHSMQLCDVAFWVRKGGLTPTGLLGVEVRTAVAPFTQFTNPLTNGEHIAFSTNGVSGDEVSSTSWTKFHFQFGTNANPSQCLNIVTTNNSPNIWVIIEPTGASPVQARKWWIGGFTNGSTDGGFSIFEGGFSNIAFSEDGWFDYPSTDQVDTQGFGVPFFDGFPPASGSAENPLSQPCVRPSSILDVPGGVLYGLCVAFRPSEEYLRYWGSTYNVMQEKIPFSYFYGVKNLFSSSPASDSADFITYNIQYPVFGSGSSTASISFISKSQIEGLVGTGFLPTMKVLITFALWLSFGYFIYHEVRTIFHHTK